MRRAFWFPILLVLLALSVLMAAGVQADPPLPQTPPSSAALRRPSLALPLPARLRPRPALSTCRHSRRC